MAYVVAGKFYWNSFLAEILGSPAYNRGNVLDIENPDATYVGIPPGIADAKILPFAYGQDPAALVAKITTPTAGQPSTNCEFDFYAPNARMGKAWKALSKNVTLQVENPPDPENPNAPATYTKVLTNPADLAQAANMLLLVDRDSRSIYRIGINELNGIPSGPHTLHFAPFNLAVPPPGAGENTDPILPADAKGQSISVITGPDKVVNVFAMFIVYNATTRVWSDSILVWLRINPETMELEYVTHLSNIGINAMMFIPVKSDNTSITFLVSCYGGWQNEGSTNEEKSKIQKVVAWFDNPNMTITPLIHGDLISAGKGTHDFRAVAARFNGNMVYILTGTMNEDGNQDWDLYSVDIDELLSIGDDSLSKAIEDGMLEMVSCGANDPGNYWDIFIESGIDITGDRFWFLMGSTIMVTGADDYGNDVKTFDTGYGIGEIEGVNVNSVAFFAETLRQAALGMSLKRGLGGFAPIISAAGAGKELPY